MYFDAVRDYCLALPETTEDQPFGPDVLVLRVAGKMYCLLNPDREPPGVNLKCDPERAVALREAYEGVLPGYHMNKRHWNTVLLDGSLSRGLITEMVEHSYGLVYGTLSKALKEQFPR